MSPSVGFASDGPAVVPSPTPPPPPEISSPSSGHTTVSAPRWIGGRAPVAVGGPVVDAKAVFEAHGGAIRGASGTTGGRTMAAPELPAEVARTTIARGRTKARTMTPRAPTLPIIPSSRASPVLGPVKAGALAGLGLLTKLTLAAGDDGESALMLDDDEAPKSQLHQRAPYEHLCQPLLSVVPLPPPPRSRGPLHPGATWSGTQRSGRASYGVSVTFTHLDMVRGVGGGYLRISQLTRDLPELVTYFDVEVIGDRHGFLTAQYGATEADDWKHWSRFPPFRTLAKPAILKDRAELRDKERSAQSAKKEAGEQAGDEQQDGPDEARAKSSVNKMLFAHHNRPVVFMRWKERFVVPDHRTRDIQGASFAGFYYVCCDLTPPPELPPLSPALGSGGGPALPTRPNRSSSTASATSVSDGGPYLSRARQRSTSRGATTVSPAPTPSPALPTVTIPATGQPRQRRASTPGTFSYAAIARRTSNASVVAPDSPRPDNDGAPAAIDVPKAEEPTSPQPPTLLNLEEFPLPSSPLPSSSPPIWRPLTGDRTPGRTSSTPLPAAVAVAVDAEATTTATTTPRGRSAVLPHHVRAATEGCSSSPSPSPAMTTAAAAAPPPRGGWQDASITAYYCHANSEPYQELVLRYRPPHRGGSGDYEFA